jgi:arginine exporter protein ArgO
MAPDDPGRGDREMKKRYRIYGIFFTAAKTLLLFFALFCIFGGLDKLIFTNEPAKDLLRIGDIFIGVMIWLVACQIHLPLRMRRW